MHKFSSSDSFPKLRPIFSSIDTFNYNVAHFLCDLLSPSVLNDYSCKDTSENEIYCYINGFLKLNVSKKTSYILRNKNFFGKICILNLRNKRRSTFARVIIKN